MKTYEDVPIFCSHNGVNFTKAQDLIFWNDDLLVVFTDVIIISKTSEG
jgi:hypothetical protein